MSAETFVLNKSKRPADAFIGAKTTPNNREKTEIEPNILSLDFIKQVNYRKISFLNL